ARQPTVQVQLLGGVRYVCIRKVRGALQGDLRRGERLARLLAQTTHRVLEQTGVGLQADGVDEARLLRAEDVACAPQLQVLQRNGVPAPQFREVLQDAEPALRFGVGVV